MTEEQPKTFRIPRREAELIAHYDNTLEYYSPLDEDSVWVHALEAFGLPAPTSVLDLGCGDGRLLWDLDLEDLDVYIGVDYSRVRIAVAKAVWKFEMNNVEDVVIKFTAEPIQYFLRKAKPVAAESGNRFAVAAIIETLEHLEDPAQTVEDALVVADCVIATVPVNMPYPAHLHDFVDEDDVLAMFTPSQMYRKDDHWVMLFTSER